MQRKAIRRGTFVLAVVTSLSFVGSQPAAARDLGFLPGLSHLWSAFEPAAWVKWASQLGAKPDKPSKKGWGMDPNGTEPPPPTGGNSVTPPPTSGSTGSR